MISGSVSRTLVSFVQQVMMAVRHLF